MYVQDNEKRHEGIVGNLLVIHTMKVHLLTVSDDMLRQRR